MFHSSPLTRRRERLYDTKISKVETIHCDKNLLPFSPGLELFLPNFIGPDREIVLIGARLYGRKVSSVGKILLEIVRVDVALNFQGTSFLVDNAIRANLRSTEHEGIDDHLATYCHL